MDEYLHLLDDKKILKFGTVIFEGNKLFGSDKRIRN